MAEHKRTQHPPKLTPAAGDFKGNPVNVKKAAVPSQDVRSRKKVTHND